jgi:hypothetical protein
MGVIEASDYGIGRRVVWLMHRQIMRARCGHVADEDFPDVDVQRYRARWMYCD